MDTVNLDIFLAIIKYRSISKAAEVLYMSQSSISKRLVTLEKDVGVSLIVRNKGQKTIELTSHGHAFIPIARQWLQIKQSMQALPSCGERIKLRIGGVHSVNDYLLPSFYQRLIENDPPIEISLSTHHSPEIYDRIEACELDAGFANYFTRRSNLDVIPIFSDPFVVLQLKTDYCVDGQIHPAELPPEKEIYHAWHTEYKQWHDQWWDPGKPYIVKLNTGYLLEHFLNREDYWCIVTKTIADSLIAQKPLFHARELACPPPPRICYLIKPKIPHALSVRGMQVFQHCLDEFLQQRNLLL